MQQNVSDSARVETAETPARERASSQGWMLAENRRIVPRRIGADAKRRVFRIIRIPREAAVKPFWRFSAIPAAPRRHLPRKPRVSRRRKTRVAKSVKLFPSLFDRREFEIAGIRVHAFSLGRRSYETPGCSRRLFSNPSTASLCEKTFLLSRRPRSQGLFANLQRPSATA